MRSPDCEPKAERPCRLPAKLSIGLPLIYKLDRQLKAEAEVAEAKAA